MENIIKGLTLDEERSLYHLQDAEVADCIFDGPADGESALKETRRVTIKNCDFRLRYPLWHAEDFQMFNCRQTDTCRAALWYCRDGRISDCSLNGIKALRECDNISLINCKVQSEEFSWRCRTIHMKNCDVTSQYFQFECRDADISGLSLHGKYSFQYTENVIMENSVLDTKDAFWHAKNVKISNSTLRGEYLAWYSENLTLINCHIIGTQPFCYCKGLTLINCTMEDTDLAFEYSDVNAEIRGHILSIKNPRSGVIRADSCGEVIEDDAIYDCRCKVIIGG